MIASNGQAAAIGVFGGTFDPIHLGHLLVAEQARDALGLSRVLFVPAGRPPHKTQTRITHPERRASMVALAIADHPAFELSRIELDRDGPSWTADTLEQLAAAESSGDRAADLVLILSADAFRDLPTWHEPRRILEAARVAVLPRGGQPQPERSWLGPDLADLADRVTILDAPRLELSGHEIRARVAAGRSIRLVVPRAVEAYIDDHSLYRDAAVGPARSRTRNPAALPERTSPS